MSEWITTTIGDVAAVFDGPHATPKKTETGPWFLSISSLDEGRLNLAESAHLSEDDFIKWTRRVTPQEGDVLFSYETRLGEAALMPAGIRACLGRRIGILRPKGEVVDPKFLLYAYLGPEFQETIAARTIPGATVDRIPLVNLPTWPIRLPELAQQREIVAVLGALDDKIAVNDLIATAADELIRALYRDAHYGGESREMPLLQALRVTFGSPFASSEFSSEGTGRPLIRIRDLRTHRPQVWTTQNLGNELVVLSGEIVAGMDAEFRPSFWFGAPALLNQRVLHAKSRVGGGDALVREALREPLAKVENYKTGTTVAHLNKSDLSALAVRIPSEDATEVFGSAAEPLRQRLVAVAMESRTLASLRDTLLPQLMSGRLRVKDAEKIVEANT